MAFHSLTSHLIDERRRRTEQGLAGCPGILQCIRLFLDTGNIFLIWLQTFLKNILRLPLLKNRQQRVSVTHRWWSLWISSLMKLKSNIKVEDNIFFNLLECMSRCVCIHIWCQNFYCTLVFTCIGFNRSYDVSVPETKTSLTPIKTICKCGRFPLLAWIH